MTNRFSASLEDELYARQLTKFINRKSSSLCKIVITVYENEARNAANQPYSSENFTFALFEGTIKGLSTTIRFTTKSCKTSVQSPSAFKPPFGYIWGSDWKVLLDSTRDSQGYEYAPKLGHLIDEYSNSKKNCDSPGMFVRRRQLCRTLIPTECAPLLTGSPLIHDMILHYSKAARFGHEHGRRLNKVVNTGSISSNIFSTYMRPASHQFHSAYILVHVARGICSSLSFLQKSDVILDIVYNDIIVDQIASNKVVDGGGNTTSWLQTILIPCKKLPSPDTSTLKVRIHKNNNSDELNTIDVIDIPIRDILLSKFDDLADVLEKDKHSPGNVNEKLQRKLITAPGSISSSFTFKDYRGRNGLYTITIGYQYRLKRLFHIEDTANKCISHSSSGNNIDESGEDSHSDHDCCHETKPEVASPSISQSVFEENVAFAKRYVSKYDINSKTESNQQMMSISNKPLRQYYETTIKNVFSQTFSIEDILKVYTANYGLTNSYLMEFETPGDDASSAISSHTSSSSSLVKSLSVNSDVLEILADCDNILSSNVLVPAPESYDSKEAPAIASSRLEYICRYLNSPVYNSKIILPKSPFDFPDVIVNRQFIRKSLRIYNQSDHEGPQDVPKTSAEDQAIKVFNNRESALRLSRAQFNSGISTKNSHKNSPPGEFDYSIKVFAGTGVIYLLVFDTEINYWDFLVAYGKISTYNSSSCMSMENTKMERNDSTGKRYVEFCDIKGRAADLTNSLSIFHTGNSAKGLSSGLLSLSATKEASFVVFDSYYRHSSASSNTNPEYERKCGIIVIDSKRPAESVTISFFDIIGLEISKSCSDFLNCQLKFFPNYILGDFLVPVDGEFDKASFEITNIYNNMAKLHDHGSDSGGIAQVFRGSKSDSKKCSIFSADTTKVLTYTPTSVVTFKDSKQLMKFDEDLSDQNCSDFENNKLFLTTLNVIDMIKAGQIPNGFICKLFSEKFSEDKNGGFIGFSHIDLPDNPETTGFSTTSICSRLSSPTGIQNKTSSAISAAKQSSTTYTMKLSILSANNVLAVDRALVVGDKSTSDPYIQVYLLDANFHVITNGSASKKGVIFKTSTKDKDLNPVWNETVEFNMKNSQIFKASHLMFEIWDSNTASVDICIGEISFPIVLPQLSSNDNLVVDNTLPFNRSGKTPSKFAKEKDFGTLSFKLEYFYAPDITPASIVQAQSNSSSSGASTSIFNNEVILNGTTTLTYVDIGRFLFPCILFNKGFSAKGLAKEYFYLDFTDNAMLIFFEGSTNSISSVLSDCSESLRIPERHFHGSHGDIHQNHPPSPSNSKDSRTSSSASGQKEGKNDTIILAVPYSQINSESLYSVSRTIVSIEFTIHRKLSIMKSSSSHFVYKEASFRGLIGPCNSELANFILEKIRAHSSRDTIASLMSQIDEFKDQSLQSISNNLSPKKTSTADTPVLLEKYDGINKENWREHFELFVLENITKISNMALRSEKHVNQNLSVCCHHKNHSNMGYYKREYSINKKLLLRQKMYIAIIIGRWIRGYLETTNSLSKGRYGFTISESGDSVSSDCHKVLELFQLTEEYKHMISMPSRFTDDRTSKAFGITIDFESALEFNDLLQQFADNLYLKLWKLSIINCIHNDNQSHSLREYMSKHTTTIIFSSYHNLIDYIDNLISDNYEGPLRKSASDTQVQINIIKTIFMQNQLFHDVTQIFMSTFGLRYNAHPSFTLMAYQRNFDLMHNNNQTETLVEFESKDYYPKISDTISLEDLIRKFSLLLSIEIQKWQKNSIIRISTNFFKDNEHEIESQESDSKSRESHTEGECCDHDEVNHQNNLLNKLSDGLWCKTKCTIKRFGSQALDNVITKQATIVAAGMLNGVQKVAAGFNYLNPLGSNSSAKTNYKNLSLWELDRVQADLSEYFLKKGMIISSLPELIDAQLNVQLNAKLISSTESSFTLSEHISAIKNVNINVINTIVGSYSRFASEYCLVAIKFYETILSATSKSVASKGQTSPHNSSSGSHHKHGKHGVFHNILHLFGGDECKQPGDGVKDILNVFGGLNISGSQSDETVEEQNNISDQLYEYIISMINDLFRIKNVNIPRSKQRILQILNFYDEDLEVVLDNSGVISDLELNQLFNVSENEINCSISFLITLLINSMATLSLSTQIIDFEALWVKHAKEECRIAETDRNGNIQESNIDQGEAIAANPYISPLHEICTTFEEFLEFIMQFCIEQEKIQLINNIVRFIISRYLLFLRDLVWAKKNNSTTAFKLGRAAASDIGFSTYEKLQMIDDMKHIDKFVKGILKRSLLDKNEGESILAMKEMQLLDLFRVNRFVSLVAKGGSCQSFDDYLVLLNYGISDIIDREFPEPKKSSNEYRVQMLSYLGISPRLQQDYLEECERRLGLVSKTLRVKIESLSCINIDSRKTISIRAKIGSDSRTTYSYSCNHKTIKSNDFYNTIDWFDTLEFDVSNIDEKYVEFEIVETVWALVKTENVIGVVVLSLFGLRPENQHHHHVPSHKKMLANSHSDLLFSPEDFDYDHRCNHVDTGVIGWFAIESPEEYKGWKGDLSSSSANTAELKNKKHLDSSNHSAASTASATDSFSNSSTADNSSDISDKLNPHPFYLTAQQEFSLRAVKTRSPMGPRTTPSLTGVPQLHVKFTVQKL